MQLVVRPGHPTFLDLPRDRSLADWENDRLVEVMRGIHRHVVRFVEYDGVLYALKELPRRHAEREYGCCATCSTSRCRSCAPSAS